MLVLTLTRNKETYGRECEVGSGSVLEPIGTLVRADELHCHILTKRGIKEDQKDKEESNVLHGGGVDGMGRDSRGGLLVLRRRLSARCDSGQILA